MPGGFGVGRRSHRGDLNPGLVKGPEVVIDGEMIGTDEEAGADWRQNANGRTTRWIPSRR